RPAIHLSVPAPHDRAASAARDRDGALAPGAPARDGVGAVRAGRARLSLGRAVHRRRAGPGHHRRRGGRSRHHRPGGAAAMSARRTTARGLTLVEVLVAITIFAIVAVVVFGGFSQTMINKQILEEDADRTHVIRVAMERMVNELSMAYVSIHVNPDPALQTMNTCFIGGRANRGHRLHFPRVSPRRLHRDAPPSA